MNVYQAHARYDQLQQSRRERFFAIEPLQPFWRRAPSPVATSRLGRFLAHLILSRGPARAKQPDATHFSPKKSDVKLASSVAP